MAVLIPCLNEEVTIGKVVRDFRAALPDATIYVYDNRSTDKTAEIAEAEGAIVRKEYRRGKGNVVRSMFADIVADAYVMVDGDDTYLAKEAAQLVQPVLDGRAHMVVGTRLEEYTDKSFRPLHMFGNNLIRGLINVLFRSNLKDVLSGYRCFSSDFVRGVPLLAEGFEVETELTLQALDKGFTIEEIPLPYSDRPPDSYSKLNTYTDGVLVVGTILMIFKDYRPMSFFGLLGTLIGLLGLALGSIPIVEFIQTSSVLHVPTAILATGVVLFALVCFSTGFILDTLNRRQKEHYHLVVSERRRQARRDA